MSGAKWLNKIAKVMPGSRSSDDPQLGEVMDFALADEPSYERRPMPRRDRVHADRVHGADCGHKDGRDQHAERGRSRLVVVDNKPS
jgi:hypothetical protein